MATTLLQNFRGARGLIVAPDQGSVDTLSSVLTKLGLAVERLPVPEAGERLDVSGVQPSGDILFIDGDLDAVLPGELRGESLPPAPVIGLVGSEAPSRLKNLINQGATAFLRKPVYAGAVYTALFIGVNQHLQRKALLTELEEHRDRRRRRRAVVKAIISIMNQYAIDDDEAYAIVRRNSMRARQSLEDYCQDYLAFRSTLTEEVSASELRQATR
jgi:AmiR/NasT family two-component response regulator